MSKEKEEGATLAPALTQEINLELLVDFDSSMLEVMKSKLSMEITDEDSARQALACCLQARKLKNKVESSRKEIVRPHLDFQKAVMKMATDISDGFEQIEKDFENKVCRWMETQRDNPFTRVDDLSVDDGSITCKTVHSYQVVDEEVIPREFLKVDDKKVQQAIAKGQRNIPGIEIITFEAFALRVKN